MIRKTEADTKRTKGSKTCGPKKEACKNLCEPYISVMTEAERLKKAIEERKTIEKAKGILMRVKGLDETEAHRLLQAHSQRESRKVSEIAEAIILTYGITAGNQQPAEGADAAIPRTLLPRPTGS